MNIHTLAHNGVIHTSAAESAAHVSANTSSVPAHSFVEHHAVHIVLIGAAILYCVYLIISDRINRAR
jgi:hypothetical protein